MIDNTEKAKKIFFDYACRHFHIDRDGLGEEYKRFGISKAQEKEWRREYIDFWVSQLSIDDMTPVNRLSDAWATEALPDLIKMADKGDSYAKLWYAIAIWKLAEAIRISVPLQEQARKTAINLWQSIVQGPIELSNNHKTTIIRSMKSLDTSTPEEYVLNYANRRLVAAKAIKKT